MARQYSPRTFIRRVPNALLQQYFRDREVELAVAWDDLGETDTDPIVAGLDPLPVERLREIEGDFSRVADQPIQRLRRCRSRLGLEHDPPTGALLRLEREVESDEAHVHALDPVPWIRAKIEVGVLQDGQVEGLAPTVVRQTGETEDVHAEDLCQRRLLPLVAPRVEIDDAILWSIDEDYLERGLSRSTPKPALVVVTEIALSGVFGIGEEAVSLGFRPPIGRAKLCFTFRPVDNERPKTLTFEVSYPDRCTLKDDPHDQIARKYLGEWGIASNDDASRLAEAG